MTKTVLLIVEEGSLIGDVPDYVDVVKVKKGAVPPQVVTLPAEHPRFSQWTTSAPEASATRQEAQ